MREEHLEPGSRRRTPREHIVSPIFSEQLLYWTHRELTRMATDYRYSKQSLWPWVRPLNATTCVARPAAVVSSLSQFDLYGFIDPTRRRLHSVQVGLRPKSVAPQGLLRAAGTRRERHVRRRSRLRETREERRLISP